MIKLKELDKKNLAIAGRYLKEVYSKAPWNEKWTSQRAEKRIEYLFSGQASLAYEIYFDKEIIGFIFGRKDIIAENDIFYLDEFFIHPIFQRKGYGSKALGTLEEKLINMDIRRVELHIIRDDIDFYKSIGYILSEYFNLEKKL